MRVHEIKGRCCYKRNVVTEIFDIKRYKNLGVKSGCITNGME